MTDNYRIEEKELEFLADYMEASQDIQLARSYSRSEFIDELERAFRLNELSPEEYRISLENLRELTNRNTDYLHRVINDYPEWKDNHSEQLEEYYNGNGMKIYNRKIAYND